MRGFRWCCSYEIANSISIVTREKVQESEDFSRVCVLIVDARLMVTPDTVPVSSRSICSWKSTRPSETLGRKLTVRINAMRTQKERQREKETEEGTGRRITALSKEDEQRNLFEELRLRCAGHLDPISLWISRGPVLYEPWEKNDDIPVRRRKESRRIR